ncbi:hypothetical protein BG000_002058 [Podila horticola]|nr:hypothetical protein BG000_002058 [Podila horticola]
MRDSPVNLPELIYRIGWFVSLWKDMRPDHDQYSFDPKHLLVCTLINRTWQRTLTPLLWTIYDSRLRILRDVPPNLIHTRSPHFRYLILSQAQASPLLAHIQSTHLRELDLPSVPQQQAVALVKRNPRITSLTIDVGNHTAKILREALESLSKLKVLSLNGGEDLTSSWITELLGNVSGLEELELRDFDELRPCQSPHQQPLLSITKLLFNSLWHRNPGFSQLLRFCPQLESLVYVSSSNLFSNFPAEEMSRNLRECCPKFKSLQCLVKDQVVRDLLDDDEYCFMLQSTQHLISFDMPVGDLSPRFCQALLDPHAPHLEIIRILLYRQDSDQFSMASKILASCPHLAVFELLPSWQARYPEDIFGLFQQPWQCPKLRVLKLSGFCPHGNDFDERVAILLKTDIWEVDKFQRSVQEAESSEEVEVLDDEIDLLIYTISTTPWTRVYVEHPDPDPQFYENLANRGWANSKEYTVAEMIQETSRLYKLVHQRVFEQLLDSTQIQTVALEDFTFVRTHLQST